MREWDGKICPTSNYRQGLIKKGIVKLRLRQQPWPRLTFVVEQAVVWQNKPFPLPQPHSRAVLEVQRGESVAALQLFRKMQHGRVWVHIFNENRRLGPQQWQGRTHGVCSFKKKTEIFIAWYLLLQTQRGCGKGRMKQDKECCVEVRRSRGSPAHLFVKPASHHNWDVKVSFNSLISLAETVHLSLSCTSGALYKGKERKRICHTGRFFFRRKRPCFELN